MEQLVVERSIWIDAPRERVWQAVTDPAQLAQWFLPPMLGAQMKRNAAGEIAVCMGPMEIPVAVLEESEPQRRCVSRSLPERLLTTTYTFEDESGGTRVNVAVSGFERLAPDARQDRLGPVGMGWERALSNLKSSVGGAELPYPEGYVAAMSGYRREAQQKYAIERSIWIKASRERVWSAITDPKQVQAWFSPTTEWELAELQVGARLFHRSPETGEEMYVQIVEVVDPPRRLVTRSAPDGSGVASATIYTLDEEGDGTRLTLTYTGLETLPEETRSAMIEQHAFGFGLMLMNIQAHVEGLPLPNPGGF